MTTGSHSEPCINWPCAKGAGHAGPCGTSRDELSSKERVYAVCEYLRGKPCSRCSSSVDTPYGKGVQGCYAVAEETIAVVERTRTNVAPIAKLTVRDGLVQRAGLYAPGLPDGDHDVFPVPLSPWPELDNALASLGKNAVEEK